MDEPLGALDMKLRKRCSLNENALQKSLGITFIYVTHDQEEALTMSDRIVVMNKGKFEQIGTAREIYEHPKTKFVADFIGESNIFEAGVVENEDGIVKLVMENGHVQANGKDFIKDEIVYICIRPENVHISTTPAENFTLKGYVTDQIFVGNAVKTVVSLPNGDQVKVNMHPLAKPIEIGTLVNVFWDEDKAVVMHTTEDNVYDLIEDSLLLGNPGGSAADEK